MSFAMVDFFVRKFKGDQNLFFCFLISGLSEVIQLDHRIILLLLSFYMHDHKNI